MIKTRNYVFIIFVFLSCFQHVSAQKITKNKRTSLKEVLILVEKKYNVKFSYKDSLVKEKQLYLDFSENYSIEDILSELISKTNLSFERVTKRYITITDININKENSICGFIMDGKLNKPIQGATIFSLHNSKGTVSAKNGFFNLKNLSELDSIKVSFVGYETQIIPVKDRLGTKCSKVDLKHHSMLLEEVIVSDYMVGGIDKDIDGSIVISPQKLGVVSGLTEPDVLQSIQLLPGVNSPNETASGLYIRGGAPDQNLVLYDGIKMYNSSHFFGTISAFNPYIVDKVKVFKSAAKAEYGNHSSGVIDIETNNKVGEAIKGGFGANMTHFDVFVSVPVTKNLGIAASVRRSFTDFFDTPTFTKLSKKVFQNSVIDSNEEVGTEQYQNTNDFYFFDINSKITYNLSGKDVLTFNYLWVRNRLDYEFSSKNNSSYNTKDHLQIRNTGYRLKWNHEWSEKVSQRTSVYYSNYDLDYGYDGKFDFGNPFTQSAFKKNMIKDYGGKTVFESELNKNTLLSLGYEFVKNGVDFKISRKDSRITNKTYVYGYDYNDTHALFVDYGYNKEDKTILNIGARTNYFSHTNRTFFAPRVYVEQQIWPKFSLKSSLEFKQQNIVQFLETHTQDFGLGNQIWLLADNDTFPILKSNQYTIGALYKENNFLIDVEFYRKTSDGLTSFTAGTENTLSGFYSGKGDVVGVDFLIRKRFNNYNTWINYSYSKTDFRFDEVNNGNSFPSDFDVRNNFLWVHNLKLGNFDFSLSWVLKTGTPFTPVSLNNETNKATFGEINSKRLPSYHKLDFSSGYSFNIDKKGKWRGKLGVSLLNVYDKVNVLSRRNEVLITDDKHRINTVEDISLGITPNFVFRVFIK
ncbi:TonB-dependent receptor domain-containing protein [Tenacibaculum sp. 190524A02b]|uniref:TonB-dependent receptor domain-containing protein n=1 Tax=Tenacibaculum vairaonense TaxID=3137860 RepID=UPI0031FB2E67